MLRQELMNCLSIHRQAGLIDSKATSGKTTPAALKATAKKICPMSFEEAKAAYPRFRASDAPYICMDLIYQYSLLVDGFGKQISLL
jgi:apyrase